MNDRRNVAYAEKQPKSTVCRLTKERERKRWPFLTPRLESLTDKTKNLRKIKQEKE